MQEAVTAFYCRLLLLRYWPPGGTATSMSCKEKAPQCLQTSAWWAKYITHTFLYSHQTGSQSRSQSARVDPGVLLTTSLTASSPDLTRLKALPPSNKNTKAQKTFYYNNCCRENDSVIKLQYKKIETPADISPHWDKLQQCLDQFAGLPVRHFILSAVQQQVRLASWNQPVQPASRCLCGCVLAYSVWQRGKQTQHVAEGTVTMVTQEWDDSIWGSLGNVS